MCQKNKPILEKAGHRPYTVWQLLTSLVVSCMDVLLPVITRMFNSSLTTRHFPDDWKKALARPLFKSRGLSADFSNLPPKAIYSMFLSWRNVRCLSKHMRTWKCMVYIHYYSLCTVNIIAPTQRFSKYTMTYHKIPKISPGAYFFQRPLLRGLFLEGLIFGGAYLRREICVSKLIGLAL